MGGRSKQLVIEMQVQQQDSTGLGAIFFRGVIVVLGIAFLAGAAVSAWYGFHPLSNDSSGHGALGTAAAFLAAGAIVLGFFLPMTWFKVES